MPSRALGCRQNLSQTCPNPHRSTQSLLFFESLREGHLPGVPLVMLCKIWDFRAMKLPLESSNPHSPKAAPKAGGKTNTPVGISEWPSSSNPPPGTSMALSTSGHAAAPLESMLTKEPHQLAVLEDALQAGSLAGTAWKLCCPDSSRLTGFLLPVSSFCSHLFQQLRWQFGWSLWARGKGI